MCRMISEELLRVNEMLRCKSASKRAHSIRFARFEDQRISRQRMECVQLADAFVVKFSGADSVAGGREGEAFGFRKKTKMNLHTAF